MQDAIHKHIELKAPVSRVWRALTDHREFSAWFGVALEGPFVVGGSTRGRITKAGCEQLVMSVTVTRLDPEHTFAFTWHPYAVDPKIDYSDETPTLVEFKLEPTAAGTMLTVTESGFANLPAHRRDEAFRMNDGGWQMQMQKIAAYVGHTA